MQECFHVPAVLATHMPWLVSGQRDVQRRRRVFVQRSIRARIWNTTDALNTCCHRRQVVRTLCMCRGGAGLDTPPYGGIHLMKGGVSQGVSKCICLLAWDFPSQGGDSPTLGEIPWHLHYKSLCETGFPEDDAF